MYNLNEELLTGGIDSVNSIIMGESSTIKSDDLPVVIPAIIQLNKNSQSITYKKLAEAVGSDDIVSLTEAIAKGLASKDYSAVSMFENLIRESKSIITESISSRSKPITEFFEAFA